MKDSRFIELVNLYIDRQLSPDEAAEFEHEIRHNPRRRQLYLQYCRMHRATTLVYDSFRAHAGQQGGETARRPATIARLENRQRRRARWSYAAAGLAAAACFAFVVVRNDVFSPADPAGSATTLAQAATAAPASTEAPAAAPAPVFVAANQAVTLETPDLVGLRNEFLAEGEYAALLAAARLQEQRLLNPGQAAPLRASLFDDGVFESRPMLRTLNPNQPSRRARTASEFTAFQFQR